MSSSIGQTLHVPNVLRVNAGLDKALEPRGDALRMIYWILRNHFVVMAYAPGDRDLRVSHGVCAMRLCVWCGRRKREDMLGGGRASVVGASRRGRRHL
jgi:hypothetical protein